jgi:hypothetical protein
MVFNGPMPSQEKNNHFDLLNEVGKGGTYQLLFPPPQAGLAILELYHKVKRGIFQHGRFREVDIHNALENSKFLINEDEYYRLPQTKFHSIISDLQVYFLRFDSDDQYYTLKDYADSFCKHAEDTLLANFNPTKIEIICNDLRAKLELCAEEKDVSQWIDTFFYAFKPIMKSQVDRLERQIDQSVQDIRATTQLENTSIIEILVTIDEKLNTIRTQNVELRSAFREMKTINTLLEEKLHSVTNVAIANEIGEVRLFFPEIKYTLNLIDKRLDRIQPKLRQFFGTLNKPSFNVKVEKFLKFLLNGSTLKQNRFIELPASVPLLRMREAIPNFTIFERKPELFPPAPKPRVPHVETPAEKQKAIARAKSHLDMYREVNLYIDRILEAAAVAPVIFSPWFFDIVSSSNGGIEMAANVAYSLIRRTRQEETLRVEATKLQIFHPDYPNLSLWEMNISFQQ